MKATCATCQHWSLQKSPMARSSLAPCALGKRFEYLPPRGTCAAHKPLEQAAADTRAAWLAKIELKYSKGTA